VNSAGPRRVSVRAESQPASTNNGPSPNRAPSKMGKDRTVEASCDVVRCS